MMPDNDPVWLPPSAPQNPAYVPSFRLGDIDFINISLCVNKHALHSPARSPAERGRERCATHGACSLRLAAGPGKASGRSKHPASRCSASSLPSWPRPAPARRCPPFQNYQNAPVHVTVLQAARWAPFLPLVLEPDFPALSSPLRGESRPAARRGVLLHGFETQKKTVSGVFLTEAPSQYVTSVSGAQPIRARCQSGPPSTAANSGPRTGSELCVPGMRTFKVYSHSDSQHAGQCCPPESPCCVPGPGPTVAWRSVLLGALHPCRSPHSPPPASDNHSQVPRRPHLWKEPWCAPVVSGVAPSARASSTFCRVRVLIPGGLGHVPPSFGHCDNARKAPAIGGSCQNKQTPNPRGPVLTNLPPPEGGGLRATSPGDGHGLEHSELAGQDCAMSDAAQGPHMYVHLVTLTLRAQMASFRSNSTVSCFHSITWPSGRERSLGEYWN